jgi:hypothetical protein
MIEDIAIKLGMKVVEKFFDGMGKGKQDPGAISIGLAVGYYYNFLDPVSGVIKRDEFSLYSTPTGGENQQIRSDDVQVEIIIPGRLDVAAYDRCETEFKQLHKGSIYLSENKRYYGINYASTELPSKTQLTIVDLARPLMSVKRYYEDIVKLDTYSEANEKWIKIQIAERTAFKETLRRLQARGYGGLVNRLHFKEIA